MAAPKTSVGAWLSAGLIALAGCSSNSGGGNSGTDGSVSGQGGSGTGGTSSGGTSSGGASSGGASSGGTNSGGTSSGGTNSGGTSSGGKDAGTTDGSSGGSRTEAGSGGGGGTSSGGASSGGASSGGASSGGTSGDAGPRKRVFVTSGTWSGDLKTAGAGTSGLDGADNLCNTAASALGGTWVAWLSDGTTNAIDRVQDVGPWYRVDGVKVFANKAALTSNPLAKIDLNEAGGTVTFFPWTGTDANGTKNASTCAGWTTSSTGNGECGLTTATSSEWTQHNGLPCSVPYNLYCFEQ